MTQLQSQSQMRKLDPTQIGKVVCVGRNYAKHAEELGNKIPSEPLLFMKPASCIVGMAEGIVLPDFGGEVHFETELCLLINRDLKNASLDETRSAIGGIGLGLDLTLRSLQDRLKSEGQPWERAKCFDGACVLGDWIDPANVADLTQTHYQLYINDELRQDGDTHLMLFAIDTLLVEISRAFRLQAGDVVMTGTPSGVGALHSGDQLKLVLDLKDKTQAVWQTFLR